ncbi:MAG: prenyltransferase/squalene oxidase repeat-containing protein [Acidimicrobiales bacterium]
MTVAGSGRAAWPPASLAAPASPRAPVMDAAAVAESASWIAGRQRRSGMIPWYDGGHADPWNHIEAAMALDVAGLSSEAEAAYAWLASVQLPSGAVCAYYLSDGVKEPRRDPSGALYLAAGIGHHLRVTLDEAFSDRMWPAVVRAVSFALSCQQAGGGIAWAEAPGGAKARDCLLTGSSSMLLSLRAAIWLAQWRGEDRPEWELAAERLGRAIREREGGFAGKQRWAMDWYYPVLCGAVTGPPALDRLARGWDRFVMAGRGVRCVSDSDWVTAAETAECAMACALAGEEALAHELLAWAQGLRRPGGAYLTGATHPGGTSFPGDELTTYSAAAMVLAADLLCPQGTGAFPPA